MPISIPNKTLGTYLNQLSAQISFLELYFILYPIEHKPVSVQMANAYLILVRSELIELELKLMDAYQLEMSEHVFKKQKQVFTYTELTKGLRALKADTKGILEAIKELPCMKEEGQGLAISMIMVNLNNAIALYDSLLIR